MLAVAPLEQPPPGILSTAYRYWSERRSRTGALPATRDLLSATWEFVRDSTPSRSRSRFGDADYDWDFRVNTTSGAVSWRDRLLGLFLSPYQPTEPVLFREMIETVQRNIGGSLSELTFVDLGSGKGRTLLMASDFPFRRIVGVELLPSLHRIAEENLAQYESESQRCFALQAVCSDATIFPMPEEPLLLYLFNPFPEPGLRRAIENLKASPQNHPRPAYLLYHNPLLEHVLAEDAFLTKIAGTHQYSIFSAIPRKT
jgi:hypothetical protein